MTTIINKIFSINGVIDTSKSVRSNMDTIARAAGAWTTFDVTNGKWSVVINQPGSSEYSFDDSNIIGSITVSGTGLTELYNSVELQFPHQDLADRVDYITFTIPEADLFPNELENTLNIQYDCVNNPVQAELLARRELKQSRVDKVIQFRTDFTSLGIRAGDIIDVTASMYGFTNKKFRVLNVTEEDQGDHTIVLSITAFEYDESVYATDNLVREERVQQNGIVGKCANQDVRNSDAEANAGIDLGALAAANGLMLILNQLTGRYTLSQGGAPAYINGTNAVISWTFQDGEDLDIRCRVYSPFLGQGTVDDYLGWTGGSGQFPSQSTKQWPPTGTPVLVWGGDNTGVGKESVAVNIQQLKNLFPTQQYFVIECRGNWYNTPGIRPVKLDAIVYQGGTLNPSGYTFTNTGYTSARAAPGLDVYIDSNTTDPTTIGDLMGYLVIDTKNNQSQFINDIAMLGFGDY